MRYLNSTKRTLKKIHHKRSTKNNKDCFYFSSFILIMFLDYLYCPWSTLNARLDVKYSPQGCRRGNYSIHYSITPYVTSLRGYRRTKRIKIRRWNIRGGPSDCLCRCISLSKRITSHYMNVYGVV